MRSAFWNIKSLEVAILSQQQAKAEQTEKATTSVRSGRETKSPGKPLPPKLETQVNTENHNLSEPNPQAETSMGTSAGVEKPEL